ncbi:hypothetical protein KPL70_009493 [Citrus sinensis]|nr:hypothetical protein KPL70_009493 [Citrus sinensis]
MDSSNIPQDDDAHALGTNERKKRGPTMMPKIVKGTSNGKKFHVNFNYKGQPVGKMRPKLSSMVGVWSRSLQRATGVYAPVPREDLWVEARKTNNGEFRSEDVKEKAEKITDLKKQVADGEISFQPGEDILTMALEKPEHPGRVQATGDGVTITSYFGRAKRKSIAIDIENIVEEKVDKIVTQRMIEFRKEFMKEFNDSQFPPNRLQSDRDSCSDLGERQDQSRPVAKDQSTPIARLSKGTFCKLALGDNLNIVAQGTVFMDNEPNATVHGIPLASTDVRVSINVAFQKNAILPRPVRDELILVSHAIGSIVAWPKKFVITSNNEVSKFVSQDVASSSMPPIVKSLFSFAKNVMHPSGSIIINFDPNMFASTTEMMFLGRDDILQFCRMEQISVSVIKLYMR